MRVNVFPYLQRRLRDRAFLPFSMSQPGGKQVIGKLQQNFMKQKDCPLRQFLTVFFIIPADPQELPELGLNRAVFKHHRTLKPITCNQ